MTEFSIIIPVYKVEEYIETCIKSLLAQTNTDFEAIFIDDCGNDNSINIVKKYSKFDNRLKIITHKENLGTGLSRNDGIDASDGEYICFLDPDDSITADYIETLHSVFKNNKSLNWVLFQYNELIDKNYKTICFSESPRYFSFPEGLNKITPFNISDFTAFCWAKSYRREWINSKNIRFPKTTYEEILFHFECLMEEPNIYIIDKPLVNYLIRNNSWSTNTDINEIKKNIQSLVYLKEFFPKLINQKNYSKKYLDVFNNFINNFYYYQNKKLDKYK